MTDERKWQEAAALSGQLLAALAFLGDHPEPCAEVRAEMHGIVREACRLPVRAAMIGFFVLVERECGTGRPVKASPDGGPELAVLGSLVDTITARLDAAHRLANGPTMH